MEDARGLEDSNLDITEQTCGLAGGGRTEFITTLAKIAAQTPLLTERVCLNAVEMTVPYYAISTGALLVCQTILTAWRRNLNKRASWWTLNYLREVAQRVCRSDSIAWSQSSPEMFHPFPNSLGLGIAIEQTFRSHAAFLLARYKAEGDHDSVMNSLWIEIMCYSAQSGASVIDGVLDAVDNVKDLDRRILHISDCDAALGYHPRWLDYLRKLSGARDHVELRLMSRCLLIKKGLLTYDKDSKLIHVTRRALSGSGAVWSAINALPGDAFFEASAQVVSFTPLVFSSETFKLIHHGLKRLFRDTRSLSMSSTTMLGYLEVFVYEESPGEWTKPASATPSEVGFLEAILQSDEVWEVRCELWQFFELDRDSLSALIAGFRSRLN